MILMISSLLALPVLIPSILGYFVKETPDWAGWARRSRRGSRSWGTRPPPGRYGSWAARPAPPGILRHAAVQGRLGVVVGEVDSVKVARPQAAAAAHTAVLVHGHLSGLGVKDQAVVGALLLAAPAAAACLRVDLGLSAGVLLFLPRPGAAAHADVLDGPAKAGHLMALEVGQGDEHIRVHHRPADLGLLHIFAPRHVDLHIVGALQAVADEDGAAHRQRSKAVLPGALQVLQGVLPAAGYMVLQSVRKGRPPSSFTTSTTARA